ncbi:DNA helicase RecQ [Pelodictyon luteolum]|uniref:DNA helicase RecQ n=1 Tax=Chlorobium luteolum (strain DSM 273 / BCRC 81028 / 2530) TaxID=319225 RepID=Q3B2B0_CHLL3|nr:DNA helicase RecQ [Pelodictyon luteolum]ABB24521.1 ATP-dependent DNA helicase RecQ [Pelodictyon luteolum DSM 273]
MRVQISDEAVHEALQRVFGFQAFRPNQREVVRAILEGRDVFAVMPTGGGKSLCYQLPAVLLPGTCIVVSPLIALMKDQVDGARANGIRAAFLNSSQLPEERQMVANALQSGELELLYVAPERFAVDSFRAMLRGIRISMAVIDEAHCISEWGHDFRPDYLSLSALVDLAGMAPVAAFTATATERVQADTLLRLALRDPFLVRASFDRPNLSYEVLFKDSADRQILSILRRFSGKAGIIYRASRKSVNDTAAMLRAKGFRALPYHAGLDDREREQNQNAFIRDEVDVIIATVAFGMGIDKSNIRFVIHADLPKSIENYYQETGRAGRDGEPAHCTLLYSQGDIAKVRFFIDAMADGEERARALFALSTVSAFAASAVCRRRALLEHFGEAYSKDNCGSCDVCTGNFDTIDCSVESQILLSAMVRTDERFGACHVIDIVTGSLNKKIKELGHDRIKTFGAGKGRDKKFWRRLVDELLVRGVIMKTEGLYPVIILTEKAVAVLRGEAGIEMLMRADAPKAERKKAEPDPGGYDSGLFEQLRALRKEIADEQGVPPYVVFSDRSLREMSSLLPENGDEMLAVSGVGEAKLQRYGSQFLQLIGRWRSEHPTVAGREVAPC